MENETFRRGEELHIGDQGIPSMLVFEANLTRKDYLDKLKARLVARRESLQQRDEDPNTLWSPCAFVRTFKILNAIAKLVFLLIKCISQCTGHFIIG